MPGVEAERSAPTDTQVGILAYFQESTRSAWATHQDKHDLEDKALALAVNGVREALQLAVGGVKEDQHHLRELLEAQVVALQEIVTTHDKDASLRAEVWRGHFQKTFDDWKIDHLHFHEVVREAAESRGQDWITSLKQLQDEKENAHMQVHADSQRAIDIADKSMTDKLGEMNQLRQQITAERGTYVNRDMMDARIAASGEATASIAKTNDARIAALERSQNIAFGIMAVLVFAIPIGLRFLP